MVSTATKRGHSSHNERFYEEGEYERKVRKRRARLITATEESFTHIRRMREEFTGTGKKNMSSVGMDRIFGLFIPRICIRSFNMTKHIWVAGSCRFPIG